jgi:hypothetical protein
LARKGESFDGSKTYKVALPANIPAGKFWSFTVYDNQTRSMLATPQRYPRAGSQSYPTPAAEAGADGATTVYFAPTKPEGVSDGHWIRTDPRKGWFVILTCSPRSGREILLVLPASLHPAGTVLHQRMASERGRADG